MEPNSKPEELPAWAVEQAREVVDSHLDTDDDTDYESAVYWLARAIVAAYEQGRKAEREAEHRDTGLPWGSDFIG